MREASEFVDTQIAARLRALRAERGWSLDELARRSGLSRATLSRLENADVSATAASLGKLCAAFGLTMTRLMRLVEEAYQPKLAPPNQPVWTDPGTGFVRRSLSPPAAGLAGEVIECLLPSGTHIAYDAPARPGLEHHLIMLDGRLMVEIEGAAHELSKGDTLRYQLFGSSRFVTPDDAAARYHLFIV
jgi:transcriptional regulator with XRE-family HTH domain